MTNIAKQSSDASTASAAQQDQTRLTLAQFLQRFFTELNENGIRWCVLRNYEGLPEHNSSEDIDILIRPTQFPLVLRLIAGILNVFITGVVRHHHEASVFIGGLEGQGIHLDFTFEFSWKGHVFLDASAVLSRSLPSQTWSTMRVPDEVDGMLNELLNTYFCSGDVKTHYRAKASRILRTDRNIAIGRISHSIGERLSTELIGLFAIGDYQEASQRLGAVRRALLYRGFRTGPTRAIAETCRYYVHELQKRLSDRKYIRIAALGPDGVGKTTLVAELGRVLRNTAGNITRMNFRPKILYNHAVPQTAFTTAAPLSPLSRIKDWLLSFVRPVIWCVEYWVHKLLLWRVSSQLILYDRYYHDVLIAPRKYHCSVPVARLIARFIPQPDLWLFIDAPPGVVCSRKYARDAMAGLSPTLDVRQREATMRETITYSAACRAFLQTRRNVVILDASQDPQQLLALGERAILRAMAMRTAAMIPFEAPQHESTEVANSYGALTGRG
jgi:thymidylate kinase